MSDSDVGIGQITFTVYQIESFGMGEKTCGCSFKFTC